MAAVLALSICASPPSRGAWIEMNKQRAMDAWDKLSPPSRGAWIEICCRHRRREGRSGRPPRGGRGLKYEAVVGMSENGKVAPLAGGVD